MHLFDEMEKTFPELEKVYEELLVQQSDFLNLQTVMKAAKEETAYFAMKTFLTEDCILLKLFECAGFSHRWKMAHTLVEWMLFSRRIRQSCINRADRLPAQE